MKIAVIGSGASGMVAAWGLSAKHQITVYEKEPELGGHVNTFTTDCANQFVFDNGFLVFNHQAYPVFSAILKKLGIGHSRAKMSLGINGANTYAICEDVTQLLRANHFRLLDPRVLLFVANIFRFHHIAKRDLKNDRIGEGTITEYLKRNHFSERFFFNFLGPIASAIWVLPLHIIRDVPAQGFINFFEHHNMLGFRTNKWFTVKGGSIQYINALAKTPNITIKTSCGVVRVTRTAKGINIEDQTGNSQTYDQLIFACHPDTAHQLLDNPSAKETALLTAITFVKSRSVCHKDPKLLPPQRGLWTAWNCFYQNNPATGKPELTVSYFHNCLYKVDKTDPVFLTIDPKFPPDPNLVIQSYVWSHFKVDARGIAAQKQISQINGKDRIWYAGSWRGYGFHEDAIGSGLDVARQLGCEHADLPQWSAPDW